MYNQKTTQKDKDLDNFVVKLGDFLQNNHPIKHLISSLYALTTNSRRSKKNYKIEKIFLNQHLEHIDSSRLCFTLDLRKEFFQDRDLAKIYYCRNSIVEKFLVQNKDSYRNIFLTLDNNLDKDKPFLLLEDKDSNFDDIYKELKNPIYGIKLNIEMNFDATNLLKSLFGGNVDKINCQDGVRDCFLHNYIFILDNVKSSIDASYGLNLHGLGYTELRTFYGGYKFSLLFEEMINFYIELLEKNYKKCINSTDYNRNIIYKGFMSSLYKFLIENEDLCLEYRRSRLGN